MRGKGVLLYSTGENRRSPAEEARRAGVQEKDINKSKQGDGEQLTRKASNLCCSFLAVMVVGELVYKPQQGTVF